MTGKDGKCYFWMISEAGGFELPLFVSDDTRKVAEYMGVTVTTLFSKMSKGGGVYQGKKYHVEKYLV